MKKDESYISEETDCIINGISSMVYEFNKSSHGEIEGSIVDERLPGGVSSGYFGAVLASVKNVAEKNKGDWTVIPVEMFVDMFYPSGNRTRMFQNQPPVHVNKQKSGSMTVSSQPHQRKITLNLKHEVPCGGNKSVPIYFRLCERFSFIYKRIWRYDFKRVNSGVTKSKAMETPCVFEIELELIEKQNVHGMPDGTTAEYLFQRLVDLLGRYDIHGKKIETQFHLS